VSLSELIKAVIVASVRSEELFHPMVPVHTGIARD
jgi:hypothetical protein